VSPAAAAAARAAAPPPPPATKIEAFRPATGSVVTLGYTELGEVSGVTVDVREMHDARATGVRGLLVEVHESEYRDERAFVDADEIPDLLKGIDALLEVKANPTKFKLFEVRYTTKGELELTAFNDQRDHISYVVRTGRVSHASAYIDEGEMRKVRDMFALAALQLVP
jgi:hypothetical protein